MQRRPMDANMWMQVVLNVMQTGKMVVPTLLLVMSLPVVPVLKVGVLRVNSKIPNAMFMLQQAMQIQPVVAEVTNTLTKAIMTIPNVIMRILIKTGLDVAVVCMIMVLSAFPTNMVGVEILAIRTALSAMRRGLPNRAIMQSFILVPLVKPVERRGVLRQNFMEGLSVMLLPLRVALQRSTIKIHIATVKKA